jgi:hypothetical protein
MAEKDDKKDDKTEDKKDTATDGDKFTVADLRRLVSDTVSELVGKGGSTTDSDTTRRHMPGGTRRESIGDEVAREIERLKATEAREQRDKTIDEQIASLTDAVKEKAPVERRRVHNFMGWGE